MRGKHGESGGVIFTVPTLFLVILSYKKSEREISARFFVFPKLPTANYQPRAAIRSLSGNLRLSSESIASPRPVEISANFAGSL